MSRLSSLVALTIASWCVVLLGRADADDARTDLASSAEGDAAAGRTYAGPTPVTTPAGDASITLRVPLYPAIAGSFAFGVTDRLEVGAGGGAAILIFDESDHPGHLTAAFAKLQVVRARRAGLAVTLSAYRRPAYMKEDPFDAAVYEPRRVIGEVGVVGSACSDPRCVTRWSGHVHYVADVAGGAGRGVLGGASLSVGRRTRMLVDVLVGNPAGELVVGGFLGLRVARPRVSFDVGVMAPFPLPTCALTARF